MSEAALRRGVKSAASVFLIAAGMHAAAHYRSYLDRAAETPARAEPRRELEAYEVLPAWHASAWTLLCMFSLCFALLLALAGTAYWWMGKELPAPRLRPLASASALLCFLGAALVAALHPLPQPVAILGLAGLCFALGSAFARR